MRLLSFDAPSEIQFIRDLEAFYQSELGLALWRKKWRTPTLSKEHELSEYMNGFV